MSHNYRDNLHDDNNNNDSYDCDCSQCPDINRNHYNYNEQFEHYRRNQERNKVSFDEEAHKHRSGSSLGSSTLGRTPFCSECKVDEGFGSERFTRGCCDMVHRQGSFNERKSENDNGRSHQRSYERDNLSCCENKREENCYKKPYYEEMCFGESSRHHHDGHSRNQHLYTHNSMRGHEPSMHQYNTEKYPTKVKENICHRESCVGGRTRAEECLCFKKESQKPDCCKEELSHPRSKIRENEGYDHLDHGKYFQEKRDRPHAYNTHANNSPRSNHCSSSCNKDFPIFTGRPLHAEDLRAPQKQCKHSETDRNRHKRDEDKSAYSYDANQTFTEYMNQRFEREDKSSERNQYKYRDLNDLRSKCTFPANSFCHEYKNNCCQEDNSSNFNGFHSNNHENFYESKLRSKESRCTFPKSEYSSSQNNFGFKESDHKRYHTELDDHFSNGIFKEKETIDVNDLIHRHEINRKLSDHLHRNKHQEYRNNHPSFDAEILNSKTKSCIECDSKGYSDTCFPGDICCQDKDICPQTCRGETGGSGDKCCPYGHEGSGEQCPPNCSGRNEYNVTAKLLFGSISAISLMKQSQQLKKTEKRK